MDSLAAGKVFLQFTLKEMLQIAHLCKSMEENHRPIIKETKARYYKLNRTKLQLEQDDKNRSILRLRQYLAIKREKQTFRRDTEKLWISTRTTSQRLGESMLSIPSEDFELLENEHLGENTQVGGILVPEPPPEEMNTPDTREALGIAEKLARILASLVNQSVGRPTSSSPGGETASKLQDDEASTQSSVSTASPSSPTSYSSFNQTNNFTVIFSRDSDTRGITLNIGSENTSGSSSIEHNPSIDNPPS